MTSQLSCSNRNIFDYIYLSILGIFRLTKKEKKKKRKSDDILV